MEWFIKRMLKTVECWKCGTRVVIVDLQMCPTQGGVQKRDEVANRRLDCTAALFVDGMSLEGVLHGVLCMTQRRYNSF